MQMSVAAPLSVPHVAWPVFPFHASRTLAMPAPPATHQRTAAIIDEVPFGWTTVGRITDPRVDEISGIVASRTTSGTYWMHNDSGDTARIFAIDTSGKVRTEVRIAGAEAIDWEEIAAGPGPTGTTNPWLYMFDTGDNKMRRGTVQVYRIPEPGVTDTTATAQRINLRYPDGRPRNIEAAIVDPRTGDIMLVSKNTTGTAELFRATRAMVDTGNVLLEAVGTTELGPLATGADISPDGSKIIVRTYTDTYTWQRGAGEDVATAMRRPGVKLPANLAHQMEAICYSIDGKSVLTLSEGVGESIFQHAA